MAEYYFRARGLSKRGRFMMELSFWMGVFFFIFVSYMLWKMPVDARQKLLQMPAFLPMSIILFYVIVIVPFRRVLRLQVYSSVWIDSSRKGFHFKDSTRNLVLSWRDLSEVKVTLDVHHLLGAYIREIHMRYSKGTIVLKPDPVTNPMEGVYDFFDEINARAPKLKTYFVFFHPVCPYCREPLRSGKTCSCGEDVIFINKLSRPWELFKDEMLFFILLGFFTPRVMPLMIALTVGAMLLPLFLTRKDRFKLLPEAREIEAQRVAEMRRRAEEAARKKAVKGPEPAKALSSREQHSGAELEAGESAEPDYPAEGAMAAQVAESKAPKGLPHI